MKIFLFIWFISFTLCFAQNEVDTLHSKNEEIKTESLMALKLANRFGNLNSGALGFQTFEGRVLNFQLNKNEEISLFTSPKKFASKLISPLRIGLKNRSSKTHQFISQVLGAASAAAAIGAAGYHIIKYKDKYREDFK